ncbi:MAG: glycosyltransferase family 2 protein [Gemmataceae bacterium]|nr:glycosyltransferase family 2 protein [Gemmataceae bacterium]
MPRLLSIVVPSRSRPDLLRACLASGMRLAPPPTEWLVVDDGSEGGVVSRIAEGFGCRVLRHESPAGFCVAANAGVRAASGDVVQVLNDDTEPEPGWAEAALARFDEPAIMAVTPLVLMHGDPSRIDSAGDEFLWAGIARKRWHGQRVAERHLMAGPVFGASGSASFYRREAFLRAGGFPEEFAAYFDDVDLSFRLNRLGTVWYEPASRVRHRVSSSYGRPAGELLALMSRNEELLYWRNLPAPALLAWLPAHAGVLLLKAARRLCEGNLLPWLRGRLRAWAGLGRRRGLSRNPCPKSGC